MINPDFKENLASHKICPVMSCRTDGTLEYCKGLRCALWQNVNSEGIDYGYCGKLQKEPIHFRLISNPGKKPLPTPR